MNKTTETQTPEDVVTRPPLTRRQKNKRRCLQSLCLVVLAVMCLNVGITSLLIAWRAPVTVSFDMKGTVDRFTGQATDKALSEAEISQLTRRFNNSLDDALTDYQKQHSALILVKPAVITGVSDITNEIQEDISRRMAERP